MATGDPAFEALLERVRADVAADPGNLHRTLLDAVDLCGSIDQMWRLLWLEPVAAVAFGAPGCSPDVCDAIFGGAVGWIDPAERAGAIALAGTLTARHPAPMLLAEPDAAANESCLATFERHIDFFRARTASRHPTLRAAAWYALARCRTTGPEIIGLLLRRIPEEPEPAVMASAFVALGTAYRRHGLVPSDDAAFLMLNALRHPSPLVQVSAAAALAMGGGLFGYEASAALAGGLACAVDVPPEWAWRRPAAPAGTCGDVAAAVLAWTGPPAHGAEPVRRPGDQPGELSRVWRARVHQEISEEQALDAMLDAVPGAELLDLATTRQRESLLLGNAGQPTDQPADQLTEQHHERDLRLLVALVRRLVRDGAEPYATLRRLAREPDGRSATALAVALLAAAEDPARFPADLDETVIRGLAEARCVEPISSLIRWLDPARRAYIVAATSAYAPRLAPPPLSPPGT